MVSAVYWLRPPYPPRSLLGGMCCELQQRPLSDPKLDLYVLGTSHVGTQKVLFSSLSETQAFCDVVRRNSQSLASNTISPKPWPPRRHRCGHGRGGLGEWAVCTVPLPLIFMSVKNVYMAKSSFSVFLLKMSSPLYTQALSCWKVQTQWDDWQELMYYFFALQFEEKFIKTQKDLKRLKNGKNYCLSW